MSNLHAGAVAAYEARGIEILASVHPMPPREEQPSVSPEKRDAHITRHLDDSNIVAARQFEKDLTGAVTSAYFFVAGRGLVGISDEMNKAALELSGQISSERAYRDTISEEFVFQRVIDWLELNVKSASEPTSLVDFVESEAAKAIRNAETWIPLPGVTIPRPIPIGRVVFRRITKQMMDEYAERIGASKSPEATASFTLWRSRLQGVTAACLSVTAEPLKAEQVVLKETEAAVAMLRFACPYTSNVYKWTPIDPSFVDGFGGTTVFHVEEGRLLSHRSSLPTRMSIWHLHAEEADLVFEEVWKYAHNLIVIDRNEFQQLLLNSLVHFSKSVLKADTSDRLMFVVTALESIFANKQDPIVRNLSYRMAIISANAPEERLQAADAIAKVYDLRSKFVHGAVPVADKVALAEFFHTAWETMFFLLRNYNKWKTKADFLAYVDSYAFRGPQFSTSTLPSIPHE